MRDMLANFGRSFERLVPCVSEVHVHPHVEAENAGLFTSVGAGAAELETLTFLNALVYLTKPECVLETGTGSGYSAAAIASALRQNGRGRLHTVELDPAVARDAQANLSQVGDDLEPWVTFHVGDSLTLIREWQGPQFDFVFFDSLVAFRHVELELLMERSLLSANALCAFHDTSRLRGEYFDDFNPEMIEALDRHSKGRQWLEFGYSRGLRILRMG